MMRTIEIGSSRGPTFPANQEVGRVSKGIRSISKLALIILFIEIFLCPTLATAQGAMQLQPVAGGLTGTQIGNNYYTSFGTMNALGIGTPGAGLTVAPLSNGALYFSQYQIVLSGLPTNHKASVTAFVSTNFLHPAAEILQNCPSTATCTSSGNYSAMSTSALAATPVIPSPGIGNATAIVGIGVFLPDNNGATAYTGSDTAAFTLTMTDLNTNLVVATANVFLNSPAETVQNAVQLTLGTAAGGLTITPASDYTTNFGNVNGLGIGPGSGLTTVSVAGGMVYSTPYLLNPAYSDFNSTGATIKVALTTNFAHPAVLQMEDADASAGPFTQITATPVQITATAADRIAITRYLGLFVSNANGPGAFTGADSASLTFTMTVP